MFYNKFQIDDYIDSGTREEHVVIAKFFVNQLATRLDKKFRYQFKIVLSCDEEFCNISFHKVRKGEKYLVENLEEYTLDSIYTITTPFIGDMKLE